MTGLDNGLSPGQRGAIIRTNAGILLIGPLGTIFSEILIIIRTFSFKKMCLKMSSGKWWPFCLALYVLMMSHYWFMAVRVRDDCCVNGQLGENCNRHISVNANYHTNEIFVFDGCWCPARQWAVFRLAPSKCETALQGLSLAGYKPRISPGLNHLCYDICLSQ